MRLQDNGSSTSLNPSPDDTPGAGPSAANGHTSNGHTNGTSSTPRGKGKAVTRVALPGNTLYEDSPVDREEFVRLVIQSLRDVGYIESAATLEAESGYIMEAPEVSEFRECILDASWDLAVASLANLGVVDQQSYLEAQFLIHQQRYMELLEDQKTSAALSVLRNDLATLDVDPEQLQNLSSLLMCSDLEEFHTRTGWDGARGSSRRRLLSQLQRYIPSSVMIPQRRISTLLNQAFAHQRERCVYHNTAPPSSSQLLASSSRRKEYSLYMDHVCEPDVFPRVTSMILEGHEDEVWNLQWSHNGTFLATCGKDERVLIWKFGTEGGTSAHDCTLLHNLTGHGNPVAVCAWSLDDSVLLTAAEDVIRMWNRRTGTLIKALTVHTETVTALMWLPDNSGFISGSMDHKIIIWDSDGNQRDNWGAAAMRLTDLTITPDQTRVVAIGVQWGPSPNALTTPAEHGGQASPPVGNGAAQPSRDDKIIVYDFATKHMESTVHFDGELTSVKVTADSRYAIINHTPDEIMLWDLANHRIARKFAGQKQRTMVIRSCFGGAEQNFIASGSEDGNVYVWHRDTGVLLETLPGHGQGSVNAIAWNPRHVGMFASCSDDSTIRIWEALPASAVPEESASAVEETLTRVGKGKSRWDGLGPAASTSSLSSFGASI